MNSFWTELNRRNVVRVGIAYAVAAWIGLEVISFAIEVIEAPHWILQLMTLLAVMGLPAALIFAWVYEMTPEGLKREKEIDRNQSIAGHTGRKLDRAIIGILVIAVIVLGAGQIIGPSANYAVDTGAAPGNTESTDSTASGNSDTASIAVLPFEDYSEASDQEYFSKGIAEEILNLLAKTNALRVAARTSSFAFAGSEADIRDIGKKLDVSTVLEGSIRKAGPKIRITAQLINVEDGYHLWSETYDRDFVDIFKIQDEIAASIIESLKVHLLGGEANSMVSERTGNVDAFSAYLIGKERMSLLTKEDLEAARGKFEESIALDSEFAPAHVQLAHAWLLLGQPRFGGEDLTPDEVDAVVTPHLEKALELAPGLPEAIAVKGYQHLNRYRYEDAEKAFDKAIELNPNYALAYNWRADTQYQQSRYLEMLADREKAYALDPMSLEISADLAFEYRSFWRPKDAERVIQRMFDLHPDHALAYEAAMENMDALGHEADVALTADKAIAAHPENADFKDWRAWILMEMGLYDEAEAMGIESANFWVYVLQGRNAEAKALVDKHLAEKEPKLNWLDVGLYYYENVDADKAKTQELMNQSIAIMDALKLPWRNSCNTRLIPHLRATGHDDLVEPMMAQCHKQYEQRLAAGYLCPCTWYSLIDYTILDGRLDLAVERSKKWLGDGDSMALIEIDPTFSLLKSKREYHSLIERNRAEMIREQQLYLAATKE